MTIDKRINYRGGGAYQGGSGAAGSAEAGKAVGSVGGPSYDSGNVSGRDYRSSARDFVQTLNNNNAIRANQAGTKFKPYRDPRPQGGGLANLFKGLASMFIPGAGFLFNQGKQGITNLGNALGDFREDFTGYRTQQEYDDARQQRIDLNRIKTLENTIQTKYLDKGRSLGETELDERLAGLRQSLGITPNSEAQNAQQFLDFSNQPELSFEDIKELAQPNINSSGINTLPMGVAPNNYDRQFIEQLAPNLEDPVKDQVGDIGDLMAEVKPNTLKQLRNMGIFKEGQKSQYTDKDELRMLVPALNDASDEEIDLIMSGKFTV